MRVRPNAIGTDARNSSSVSRFHFTPGRWQMSTKMAVSLWKSLALPCNSLRRQRRDSLFRSLSLPNSSLLVWIGNTHTHTLSLSLILSPVTNTHTLIFTHPSLCIIACLHCLCTYVVGTEKYPPRCSSYRSSKNAVNSFIQSYGYTFTRRKLTTFVYITTVTTCFD